MAAGTRRWLSLALLLFSVLRSSPAPASIPDLDESLRPLLEEAFLAELEATRAPEAERHVASEPRTRRVRLVAPSTWPTAEVVHPCRGPRSWRSTCVLGYPVQGLYEGPLAIFRYGATVARAGPFEYDGRRNIVRAYDDADRLLGVDYPDKTVTYGYDGVGNRLTELEEEPETGAVLSDRTFVYDARHRLVSMSDAVDPSVNVSYEYDANGNQTSRLRGGVTTRFRFDALDQVSVAEEEEAEGTLRLLGSYRYDAGGLRVEKITDTGTVRYAYDDQSVLTQFGLDGITISKYEYGPDRLLSLDHSTEGRQFYLFDALGSVVDLTGTDGAIRVRYQWDAWGNQRAQVGDSWNPFAFTGHELDDETGLYYAKARFYDPQLGLFLSEDQHLGAPDAPPSLHRYLYAYQNPTVYIDPDGRIVTQLLGGVVSTAVGFGIAKLTGQDYDLKDAAIDFTLGAATSGLSVASKIGKVGKFAAEAALDVGAEATRQFIEEGEIDAGALAKGAVMNAIIGEAGARIGGRVARRLGFDGGGSTGPRGPPTETKVKSVVTGESGSAPGVSAAQVNGQKSVAPTRSWSVDRVAGGDDVTVFRVQAQTSSDIVTGGAFRRTRESGKDLVQANRVRKRLLRRANSGDSSVRLNALQNAQASGRQSPFISTTLSEKVARKALAEGQAQGRNLELLTIRGPREAGVDFEKAFRSLGGRTKPTRLKDAELEEFGIPDLFIPGSGKSKSGFEVVGRE